MKKLIWAATALMGFVAGADFGTALDCEGLTFATGGDAYWYEQTDAVKVGGSALRSGKISHDDETWLETVVTNAGMVSFWWKASSESAEYDWLEVSVDGEQKAKIGGEEGWLWKAVPVVAGQTVRWTYRKDEEVSVGEDCGWLDGVEFLAVPEKMTVTFVTNGGGAIDALEVEPGDKYGDLPEPTPGVEGVKFAGWCLDEALAQTVEPDDLIVYRDVTLYAKWRFPVSVLDTDDLTFFTDEEEPWVAEGDSGAIGGYVLRSGSGEGPGTLYAYPSGKGTLKFKWRRAAYLDYGAMIVSGTRDFNFGGRSGEWSDYSVSLYGDCDNVVEWFVPNLMSEPLYLKDFEWVPAPESVTVSFDANGGSFAGTSREYAPGETYGELEAPTRSGHVFLGWYENSLKGRKASESGFVPLCESVTLVAKWGADVSSMATEALKTFESDGAVVWRAVEYGGTNFAEVELAGGMDGENQMQSSSSALSVTTDAAGFLDFKIQIETKGYPSLNDGSYPYMSAWANVYVYLDGEKVASSHVYGNNQEREVDVPLYITAGSHTLTCEVEGMPAMLSIEHQSYDEETGEWKYDTEYAFGDATIVRVGDFKFEAEGEQADLQSWTGKVRRFKSWRTGDLARFAAGYKSRFTDHSDDYEARILYAVTRLGALAEDDTFKEYAESFGLTVDWARLSVTPPKPEFGADGAAINEMADGTLALVSPVFADVQSVLAGIPESWTGSVTLSSEEWPVDESVAIDSADVLFARAGLDAALAGLNYLAAHDLTVDWEKVGEPVETGLTIPVLEALPDIGDDASWDGAAYFREAQSASRRIIPSIRLVSRLKPRASVLRHGGVVGESAAYATIRTTETRGSTKTAKS